MCYYPWYFFSHVPLRKSFNSCLKSSSDKASLAFCYLPGKYSTPAIISRILKLWLWFFEGNFKNSKKRQKTDTKQTIKQWLFYETWFCHYHMGVSSKYQTFCSYYATGKSHLIFLNIRKSAKIRWKLYGIKFKIKKELFL